MKFSQILIFFLSIFLLVQPGFVCAFETDQFNLPDAPLADIGGEVNDYVEQSIRKAFERTNAEIVRHQACLDKKSSGCDPAEIEKAKLEKLRSEDIIVRRIFNILGGGIPPFTNAGTYMDKHRFNVQPARYKPSFADSIFTHYPINYLTLSPTVKIYGAQFGTDKVAHFFQQGYSYYRIYERARAKNISPAGATKKAVDWGKKTEQTIYGTLVSGVFSNADLCSNYTGMRFYQNLTREIGIGGQIHPPILVLKNGVWTFNENVDIKENLLEPFLTGHLNEALNPSIYTSFAALRSTARRVVREKDCPQWRKQFPSLTRSDFENQSDSLKLWHGEDYGFTGSRNFITIAGTCFDDQEKH